MGGAPASADVDASPYNMTRPARLSAVSTRFPGSGAGMAALRAGTALPGLSMDEDCCIDRPLACSGGPLLPNRVTLPETDRITCHQSVKTQVDCRSFQ